MTILAIIWGILSGLAINEFSDLSPWAARKIVRWSARVRYTDPGRAKARSEELAALIDARPGKLFKLITALCFAAAAIRAWTARAMTNMALVDIRVTGGGALAMNIATTASLALIAGLALYDSLTPPAQPTAISQAQSPSAPDAGPAVRAFIAAYISAVNTHDYQKYSRLLSVEMQQNETAAEFRAGFGSTTDSDVKIAGRLAERAAGSSRLP